MARPRGRSGSSAGESAVYGAASANLNDCLLTYLASMTALGRWRLGSAMLLVLIGSVVEGLGILLLIPVIDLVFAGSGSPKLGILRVIVPHLPADPVLRLVALLGIFLTLLIVRALILWRRDMLLAALSQQLVEQWRLRLIARLGAAPWIKVQALRHNDAAFAMSGDIVRLNFGSEFFFRSVAAALQLGVQLALAFYISWPLTLAACAIALAATPALILPLRRARQAGTELGVRGRQRLGMFADFLSSLKLAKAHGLEQAYVSEFARIGSEANHSVLAYLDRQLRGSLGFQLGAAIMASLLLLVGLAYLHLSATTVSALMLLIARLAAPTHLLVQGAQAVSAMLPAVSSIIAIEHVLGAPEADADGALQLVYPRSRAAELALTDVSFRYPGNRASALEHVSLVIPRGSFVALLGASGAGKSTLADLLTGLLAPDVGTITVDGLPLNGRAAMAPWRRRIGYVPQEPFLFDRSLRENMTWGANGSTDADIERALARAEALDFARQLPEGLGTRLGERGSHLSGGERQRICLARALLRDPAFLLLDEATSALDKGTERRLMKTLVGLKGKVTILMITHRLPEDIDVDIVAYLEEGALRIAPAGQVGLPRASR